MIIFNSYVSLPEGIQIYIPVLTQKMEPEPTEHRWMSTLRYDLRRTEDELRQASRTTLSSQNMEHHQPWFENTEEIF